MKLIFASAKDKINTYKIEDPYLKSFINKYEKLVPWNSIKTKEDINIFIQDVLFKDLYTMIDPKNPNNNYMKDIDLEKEFERNMDNPNVKKAYKVVKRNRQEAKNIILKPINDNKKSDFFSWWDYMMKGNDEYKKHPSFIYMVLKPVFDSSPENTKRGPLGQNALAVAKVYGNVVNQDRGNFIKDYKKALLDIETAEMEKSKINHKDGWLRIPSAINDPKNFNENVKKLKNLSIPRGWCTGDTMARPYLSNGDFWLYIEDREARVAIRFDGDRIQEIQGHQNSRPFQYWENILNLINEKGFDKESSHYKELEKAKIINENLDKDPSYIKVFEDEFFKDPKIFEMLSKERQSKPEFIDLALQYWENQINNSTTTVIQHWGSKLSLFSRTPIEIRKKLNRETLETIFNEILYSVEKNKKNIQELKTRDDFFKMYDYAKRFAKFIEPLLVENPWLFSIISYTIEKEIDPELINSIKNNSSYNLAIDLETIDTGNSNPEEIIQKYYNNDFFDLYIDADEDDLEKMRNRHDDYSMYEKLDPSLYDVSFIEFIKDGFTSYWYDYVQEDPITRYSELDDFVSLNSEHYDYDDLQDCYNLYEQAWSDAIYENPKRINEVPDGILDYFFEDDEEDYYVNAWVNYIKKPGNFDELFEVKSYIYNDSKLDSFYENIFSKENFPLIKEEANNDIFFIFEEDNYNIIDKYSDFFNTESEFVKDLINKKLKEKPDLIRYFYDILLDLEDEHPGYYFSEEDLNKYLDLLKIENIKYISDNPNMYEKVRNDLKNDVDIIKSWESTIEKWTELLWRYGTSIIEKAPKSVQENPIFLKNIEKFDISQRIRNGNVEALLNFDKIIEPYKDDGNFIDIITKIAINQYFRLISNFWKFLGKIDMINKFLGKVPDFFAEGKDGDERMLSAAEKIASDLMSHSSTVFYGYRSTESLTGKELSAIDPRLVKLMLPFMKKLSDDVEIYGYGSLYRSAQYIAEAYFIRPDLFQDNYDFLKNQYIHLLGTFGREQDKKDMVDFVPLLFWNDPQVISKVKEAADNYSIDNSEFLNNLQKTNVPEKQEDNKEEVQVMSNSWYRSHKKLKFSQAHQLIDSSEVESIIEGLGTTRFTIGFKKKDGSFRVMNAQRKVQRPYRDREFDNYSGPTEYITLYDLQKASEIAREALSDVNIDKIDPSILRLAYRRVYPHTIEFIKGGGNMYIVKGSAYAEEHGLIENEVN